VQGLLAGRWQGWRTIAGMIGVITAALAGSAAGLLAAVSSDHSLAATLAAGAAIFVAVLWALMRDHARSLGPGRYGALEHRRRRLTSSVGDSSGTEQSDRYRRIRARVRAIPEGFVRTFGDIEPAAP
jgi:hypothetical protein